MLAKQYKLPVQDFIDKRGQLAKNPYFWIKKFAAAHQYSRFAATISVKVAKKAAKRNQLRRMVYNYIRERYKQIPVADYWITVSPQAAALSKNELAAQLDKLLISN